MRFLLKDTLIANKTCHIGVIVIEADAEEALKGVIRMNDDKLRDALVRLRSGDSEALAEIYDGLSAPVFTVALRITKDRALAEDVVQELFIKLYRSPPEVKKPRAYIFQAARNTALDMLKRNPAHESVEEHGDIAAPVREDVSDVVAALEALPEQQRAIVTLHINAGLKFREIAEVTGDPLGTVLWRYRKALSTMREFLIGGAK